MRRAILIAAALAWSGSVGAQAVAHRFFRERLTRRELGGVALLAAGVVLVTLG